MEKFAIFLALISLYSSKVDGRSYHRDFPRGNYYGDRGIVFEIESLPKWHTDDSSEEWVQDDSRETGHKYPRNWDPDRIWFPDFDQRQISTRRPTTKPTVHTPVNPRNVNECISQCPTTPEYNPVCGTNRITYSNLGRLECASACGVDVRLLQRLPCSFLSQESTTTESTSTLDAEQHKCIRNCPATPEYNPICGTNNVTYQNRGRLECAKYCGIEVEVKRLSPCPTPVTTISPTNEDFFKSDQWASSTSNLFSSTIAPDKPKFTIPQELLNEIFNVPTADSNEVDIDVRQH